jgi:hypothetical protein
MQPIQSRIDFQKGHQWSPFLKVSFKRDHGLFFFSEPRIDLRYVELSDVRRISFVPFLNFLPESLGSLRRECLAKCDLIGSNLGVVVPSKESSRRKLRDGLRILPELGVQPSKMEGCNEEVGIQRHRVELLQSLIILPSVVVGEAQDSVVDPG